MAKHIPVSTNTVQVNELAGRDPGEVDRAFGDRVHQSDDRLIVAHHSVPLRSLEAKIVRTGRSILGVLDSGSEIVAMPKWVWEDLSLPVQSDHVMTMSNDVRVAGADYFVLVTSPLLKWVFRHR